MCRGILLDGGGKRDLIELVLVIFIRDYGETGKNPGFSLTDIHIGAQRFYGIGPGNHLAVGRDERVFQRGHDLIAVNCFFLFVILDEGDNIVGHSGGVCDQHGDIWRRKRVGARPTPFFRQKPCGNALRPRPTGLQA